MEMTTQDVAKRCIEDAVFARTILDGDDYPEVREALLADLGPDAEGDVQGYCVSFQPQAWSTLSFTNLGTLARPGTNNAIIVVGGRGR